MGKAYAKGEKEEGKQQKYLNKHSNGAARKQGSDR